MDATRVGRVLCGIFFISGASALVFETLWFRQASLAFGNSIWASSLVLAAFMTGLASGNALAARYADRFAKPLRAYALLEVTIGASGAGLVFLLPLLAGVLAPVFRPFLEDPGVINPLRLGFAFVLLLAPSVAMGLTLPLLAKVLGSWGESFGSALGRLYGWNTLGAVAGTLLTEVFLLSRLGIRGTALLAGTLNVACAAGALALSDRMRGAPPISERPPEVGPPGIKYGRWLFSAALTGAILLALEVIWFRFISLYVTGYAIVFALMLAVILTGIALGGLSASWLLRRNPGAHGWAGPVALLGGASVSVAYFSMRWAALPMRNHVAGNTLQLLLLCLPLMLPTSLLSGLFFTLAGTGLRTLVPSDGTAAGRLTLWNTAGAALGALAGGFLLLPFLGIERSLFLLAGAYLLAGLGLTRWRNNAWIPSAASAALCLLALALFPSGQMNRLHIPDAVRHWEKSPQTSVVAVREGWYETTIAIQVDSMGQPLYRRLVSNAISMSSTRFPSRRYMELFVRIPQALGPRIRRALLISYGVGVTARALTDVNEIEAIDIVDISPDILSFSPLFSLKEKDPLRDPRVRVHIEDGRFFLQTSAEKYDLITGEPPPPRVAGVVNLYTREYFELMRRRLTPDGLVTYWLPLHAMSKESAQAVMMAFCDAFPDATLWSGVGRDLILMGGGGAPLPSSGRSIGRPWEDPSIAGKLRAIGVEKPEQVLTLFLGDASYMRNVCRGALPVVDDFPKRIDLSPASPESDMAFWRELLAGPAARTRMTQSPWARAYFPQDFLGIPQADFAIREMMDQILILKPRPFFEPVTLHNLWSQTDLVVPIWLILGSNMDLQRVARSAGGTASTDPEVLYHAAVGLLAERKYGEALAPLEGASKFAEKKGWADALRVCALAEMGRIPEARALGTRLVQAGTSIPPEFWQMMRLAYGPSPEKAAEPPSP
jgi:spermidine synthase